MPTFSPTLNLLSASANYNADDWATFGAQGLLDIRPVATLSRGFDLGISAEALVTLDASIRKFIAADASGFATASAGVRAQLQTPIDLFGEAGAALRLQAQAQAAAGVQLGIGLVAGDFLAIVDSDPRLNGAPARLVRVLLDETTVGGGAMAKAAVAAMAYVNVSATGRLIPQGTEQAGFTVAVEKGAGWGAGAGIKGFVHFGVDDPRNLLRRSVDVAVDSTLDDLSATLLDPRTVQLLDELRTPLKVALRVTFEIGLELAKNGGTFSSGAGQTLALRALQVFLEEAQRFILDRVVRWAVGEIRAALGALPIVNANWNASAADRNALAAHLRNLPAEPFEATPTNVTYWRDFIDKAARVLTRLGGQTSPDDPGVEALAAIYAATQLLFIAVDRISNGTARASVVGVDPVTATASFTGSITGTAQVLEDHINKAIGKPSGTRITQDALVTYLVEGRVLSLVAAASPALETLASVAAGEGPGAIGAGFSTLLTNIGAFVPDGSGGVDPRATLAAVLRGLRAYAQTRIDAELMPRLTELLGDQAPEIRTYLDEVLLSSLNFTLDVVFTRILDWASGSTAAQTALREACSAVLMRLFGRSLVVTADAVLTRLISGMSGAFADLSQHINDPGGVAQKLLTLVPPGPILRDDLAELLSEHFLVLSQAAKPLDPQQRARIRDLLYQLIDTAPASLDDAFTDQLMTDLGVRNLVAGEELARELGALWAERFVDFLTAWLARVGTKLLEIIAEIVDAIVTAVAQWIEGLEALVRELNARVAALFAEIGRLALQVEQALDAALGAAAQIATRLAATGSARTKLRGEIKTAAIDKCMAALADAPGYGLVPGWAISQVRSALRGAVDVVLNDAILVVVLDAIRGPALEAADFLRDLRDIEPGDDLVEAVMDLFLDRLEDGIRDAFGGSSPRVDLRIKFMARATLNTPFGPTEVSFDVDIDLGSVRIPLQVLIDAARAAARAIDAVASAVEDTATKLSDLIHAEMNLDAAETEHAAATVAKGQADSSLQETYPACMDALIVSPAQGTVADQSVVVDIHLPGVPLSYLGAKLHPQRVHVWLNDEELPFDRFDVRSLVPVLGPGDIQLGLHGALAGTEVAGRRDPHGFALAAQSRVASNRTLPRSAGHGTATSLAASPDAQIVARISAAAKPMRRTAHPAIELQSALRASVHTAIVRPGRPLRLTDREKIEARSFPGIAISRRLSSSMLVPGVNTLAVSIVDGRTRFRVERSSVFVVVPAASRPKPNVGRLRLEKVPTPALPAYPLDKMPASVRAELLELLGVGSCGKAMDADAGPEHEQPPRRVNRVSPTWIASREERAKTVSAHRKRAVTAIEAKRTLVKDMHKAISDGALQPVVPKRPRTRSEKDETA